MKQDNLSKAVKVLLNLLPIKTKRKTPSKKDLQTRFVMRLGKNGKLKIDEIKGE